MSLRKVLPLLGRTCRLSPAVELVAKLLAAHGLVGLDGSMPTSTFHLTSLRCATPRRSSSRYERATKIERRPRPPSNRTAR